MRREDLRVLASRCSPDVNPDCLGHTPRPVTDADLASLGLVQAPECGECFKGAAYTCDGTEDPPCDSIGCEIPCPSCGGSGKGRLVNLTGIDVEALRASLAAHQRVFDLGGTDYLSPASPIWRAAKAVLAALDREGA